MRAEYVRAFFEIVARSERWREKSPAELRRWLRAAVWRGGQMLAETPQGSIARARHATSEKKRAEREALWFERLRSARRERRDCAAARERLDQLLPRVRLSTQQAAMLRRYLKGSMTPPEMGMPVWQSIVRKLRRAANC